MHGLPFHTCAMEEETRVFQMLVVVSFTQGNLGNEAHDPILCASVSEKAMWLEICSQSEDFKGRFKSKLASWITIVKAAYLFILFTGWQDISSPTIEFPVYSNRALGSAYELHKNACHSLLDTLMMSTLIFKKRMAMSRLGELAPWTIQSLLFAS